MPTWIILLLVAFLFFAVVGWYYERQRKSGREGEENTLRIIKNFLKNNNYQKSDYLLVSNLILQKTYYNCEIDILLLTRKWIYVIEVKDWRIGKLKGNFNDEYLELSYEVGNRGWQESKWVYSPFFQNEIHIKRLRSYFYLSEPNILSVVVFYSPNFLERSKFWGQKNKLELTDIDNIGNILVKYESQETKLSSFEKLRGKIGKEAVIPNKTKNHLNWSRSVRERKGL